MFFFFHLSNIKSVSKLFSKNDIENFMCMGSVDGWDSPYIYIQLKNPLLHNGCTFIVQKPYRFFFIKVDNLKPSPNLAYKWFYGMLIHYTLQKNCKGTQKVSHPILHLSCSWSL